MDNLLVNQIQMEHLTKLKSLNSLYGEISLSLTDVIVFNKADKQHMRQ